mmetsp:Transcript_8156/g.16466  ORF Transcript_8156/g.16466 Transcript_8156/m.16466 type:complete len:246 (+) Transcript_8156:60-797(+)
MPPKSLSLSSPTKKVQKKSYKLVPPSQPRSPVKRKREKKDFFTPSPSKKIKALSAKNKRKETNDGKEDGKDDGKVKASVTPSPQKEKVQQQRTREVRSRNARKLSPLIDVDSVDIVESSSSQPLSQLSFQSFEDVKKATYVPKAIYKNIGYRMRDNDSIMELSVGRRKALTHILSITTIPSDFETRKYGPLSGITWEDRVLTSYDSLLIGEKDNSGNVRRKDEKEWICTECGIMGHRKKHCTKLI